MSSITTSVQDLIANIPTSDATIEALIENAIHDKPNNEKVAILVALLDGASVLDEKLLYVTHAVYRRLTADNLHLFSFQSTADLHEAINFKELIAPQLARCQELMARNDKRQREIETYWGAPLDMILGDLCPPQLSMRFLTSLAMLSKLIGRASGVSMLRTTMENRVSSAALEKRGGYSVRAILQDSDIRHVLELVRFDEHALRFDTSARTSRNAEKQSQEGKRKIKEKEIASDLACNSMEIPCAKKIRKYHAAPTANCGCTNEMKIIVDERLPKDKSYMGSDAGLRVIGAAITTKMGLEGLCQNHLRLMVSTTLGLNNSSGGATHNELIHRLEYCYKHRKQLPMVRKIKNNWFHKDLRNNWVREKLGSAKYTPVMATSVVIDQTLLWKRFGSSEAQESWQRDGTINVEGVFNYLFDDPSLAAMIDDEFELYKYHYHAAGDPGSHMGWQRNMWYSLVQQLVRQDPVYYALSVAARPDGNSWLISYPYYTKATESNQRTGFMHFDLNVKEFLETGRGGNIIQGALSLTDEKTDNCTILVPGFHKHIENWYKEVKSRGKNFGTAHTTGVKQEHWQKSDEEMFGKIIPVPCKRGTIRLTRPEILHGSTAHASGIRRVIFPWYTGIRKDHQKLDIAESESWEEVAACHSYRRPCKLSPSGKASEIRNQGQTFQASVELELAESYPIGKALIGASEWTDYEVIAQQKELFGVDDRISLHLIEAMRKVLVDGYRKSFERLRRKEMMVYGVKSYFYGKENGLNMVPPPDGDDDNISLASDFTHFTVSSNEDSSEEDDTVEW